METIIYQGRQIEAAQIGEIDSQTRAPGGGYYEASDTLWRDGSGEYYLRRVDCACQSRVHRMSLRGAALFAVEVGTGSRILRAELSEALEAPQSQNASRQFGDGSMDVTLRLKPGPARLFRAACELDDRSPVSWLYDAVNIHVLGSLNSGTRQQEAEHEAIFDDNAPEEEEAAGITAIDLLQEDGSLCARMALDEELSGGIQAAADAEGIAFPEAFVRLLRSGVEQQQRREAMEKDAKQQKVGVSFPLEPLHATLLSRFCERQKFDVAAVVRAALVSELEAIFSDPAEEAACARHLAAIGRFGPEKSALARWEMMEQAQVSQEDLEAIAACEREDALFPGIRELARGPYEIEKDGVIVRPWEDGACQFGNVFARSTRCGCLYTLPGLERPSGRTFLAEDVQWLSWPEGDEQAQAIEAPERNPECVRFQLLLPESGRPVEGGVRTIIKAMTRWNEKHGLPDEWANSTIWKAAEDGRGIQIDMDAMEARERLLAQAGGEAAAAQGKEGV
jgi:hypothetical protein